jgi:hypothetical protein
MHGRGALKQNWQKLKIGKNLLDAGTETRYNGHTRKKKTGKRVTGSLLFSAVLKGETK